MGLHIFVGWFVCVLMLSPTWIDGCICLDPSTDVAAQLTLNFSIESTDHPRGQRVIKSKRIANGQNLLSHA